MQYIISKNRFYGTTLFQTWMHLSIHNFFPILVEWHKYYHFQYWYTVNTCTYLLIGSAWCTGSVSGYHSISPQCHNIYKGKTSKCMYYHATYISAQKRLDTFKWHMYSHVLVNLYVRFLYWKNTQKFAVEFAQKHWHHLKALLAWFQICVNMRGSWIVKWGG